MVTNMPWFLCPLQKLRPSDCLLSSPEDVQEDARAIADMRRHLKQANLAGELTLNTLLSPKEIERLQVYKEKFFQLEPAERCAYKDLTLHIGDNPAGGWLTWSARSHAVPTLRHATSLYVAVEKSRQVTLRELYGLMGYPAFAALSAAANVPLYNPFQYKRSWSEARKQLGNGMHIACVGVLVAVWLSSYKPR